MKDLILITAYCPDFERIKILQSLLLNLSNFRDDYDIMITSHSRLDSTTQEYCDYYFYNRNNNLLTDIEYLQNGFFVPYEGYKIWSTYILGSNTTLAIFSMLVPGIMAAKSMGYTKIHYMEYDTVISDISEIDENSKILDDHDYVIYRGLYPHHMVGSIHSFTVAGLIDELKNYSENEWKNIFKNKYPRIPENIVFDLIDKQKKYKVKNLDKLHENGIRTSIVTGTKPNWCFPFFDHDDYYVKFLCRNKDEDIFNMSVIVNSDKIITFNNVDKNEWHIKNLDSIKDIKSITVLKNNKHFYDIDFNQTPDYKDKFLRLNYVRKDE